MHRSITPIAPIVLCLTLLAAATHTPLRADQDTRELEIAGVRIPCYHPTWGGEHPLRLLTERLAADERSAVVAALERVTAALDGRLLPPLTDPRRERLPRIGPVEEVLGAWAAGLSDQELGVLDETGDPRRTLRGGDRVLWDGRARDAARRQLEVCLADGRLGAALRLRASPNRPALDPGVAAWLAREHAPTRNATHDAGAWRSTAPDGTPPPAPLPGRLRLIYQLRASADGARRFLLPGHGESPDLDASQLAGVPRRIPLAAVYPLVTDQRLLLPLGSEALLLQHGDSPRLLSSVLLGPSYQPGLLHVPVLPVVSRHSLVLNARTAQPQHRNAFFYTYGRDGQWRAPAFSRAALLDPRRIDGPAHATRDAHAELARAFREYTLAGAPGVAGDVLYVPVCRGWNEVRLELWAYDERNQRMLWQRHLGTVPLPWHSKTDIEAVVPNMQVHVTTGSVVVTTGAGWLARVDARTGEYRGVLFYPRHERRGLDVPRRVGQQTFFSRPALRPRYPGPAVRVPRTAARAPLLVILPGDSRHLLAVDLERWTLAWLHEVAPLTMLLGAQGGQVWLLDCGMTPRVSTLELRALDPHSGRLVMDAATLELRARLPAALNDESPDLRPLLTGVPRLGDGELWVPTLLGLEVWDLENLAASGPATRILHWPPQATGGTPIPLPGGRIATIARGDLSIGQPGGLEIYAAPDE